MTTYLDRILERHRQVAAVGPPLDRALLPRPQIGATHAAFARAARGRSELAVIAEIKRRSPSKGDLAADLDPATVAQAYERGRCELPVGADRRPSTSAAPSPTCRPPARACRLPVLRKDFTVGERDVLDARLMGADCVLLIAAALDDARAARRFTSWPPRIGLDVLVEIHDEAELELRLAGRRHDHRRQPARPRHVQVDHERAVRMAAPIPDRCRSCRRERRARSQPTRRACACAGYDAVLVGESLVTAADPAAAIARAPRRRARDSSIPLAPGPFGPVRLRTPAMFVKICGITNEDDALFAVAMGADAVGFVFAPSPRQIAAQQVFDITRRLPPEILTVGVFRDELPSRVIETVNRAGLKAAQLHGHESPAMVAEVAEQIRWVIKALRRRRPRRSPRRRTSAPTPS